MNIFASYTSLLYTNALLRMVFSWQAEIEEKCPKATLLDISVASQILLYLTKSSDMQKLRSAPDILNKVVFFCFREWI